MIFCKNCNYVGLPITVKPVKKINQSCEVCPICQSIENAQYYVDAAAAHHAQANFKKEAAKCI